MQKVMVAEVEVDHGETDGRPWTKVTLIGEDGSRFSTFDHKAEGLKGSFVELDPIIKGQYVNFKKWNILEEATIQQPPQQEEPKVTLQPASPYQSEIEARAKNTALMQACELAKSDKIDVDKILAQANKFLVWLQGGCELGTRETNVITQHWEDPFGIATEETTQGNGSHQFDNGIIRTTDQLFALVASKKNWKDAKTARTWIVNVCKISEEKINNDPAGCYEEIKKSQGW